MKTKYRIKVETDEKGREWYTPQRRILFIWYSYTDFVDMDGGKSVISFTTKEEALKVINKWKAKKVFPKVNYINL